MRTATSSEGSSTSTTSKRRLKASSFSMYLRYSAWVVAPMTVMPPRASSGLRRLAAPAAPPWGSSRTWISSTKRMVPGRSLSSARMPLRRSSISPLYAAPAMRVPGSSSRRATSRRRAGTSPAAMSRAKPSTRAVFPTPGSPTMMTLGLVRRPRISATLRISRFRPITGSMSPARASAVRSTQKRASDLPSVGVAPAAAPATLPLSLACASGRPAKATKSCCSVSGKVFSSSSVKPTPGLQSAARTHAAVVRSRESFSRTTSATSRSLLTSGAAGGSPGGRAALGYFRSRSSAHSRMRGTSKPRSRSSGASPTSSWRRARVRCGAP